MNSIRLDRYWIWLPQVSNPQQDDGIVCDTFYQAHASDVAVAESGKAGHESELNSRENTESEGYSENVIAPEVLEKPAKQENEKE
jgi:hypothetical protein